MDPTLLFGKLQMSHERCKETVFKIRMLAVNNKDNN